MRTHQVEVDDEVFSFVKSHAEPLVDNFNSALRRLLLDETRVQRKPQKSNSESTIGSSQLLPLPNGTPMALRHILEVTHLVRGGAYVRTAATQFVAKHHNVTPQAVIDKYTRQLGLTASQFDRLLEEAKLDGLRKILMEKFSEYKEIVSNFLSGIRA